MADFSVYCYQCCPLRSLPFEGDIFPEETKKSDDASLDSMKRHQEIIAEMFTSRVEELFRAQKKNEKGELEKCLAFAVGGKLYPFKVLMPKAGGKGDGIIMLRVAKLTKKNKELNFLRGSWIDEPSALVIIDNSDNQQRVLIENTTTWPDTDALRNIIKNAINEKLRKEKILMVIEPVWRKADFWNTVRRYKGHIRSIEFELGYPNMGRTGDKVLQPIKDSLSRVYAAGSFKFAFNNEVRKELKREVREKIKKKELPVGTPVNTAMAVDPDDPDSVIDEMATHVTEGGHTARIGLDSGTTIRMGRIPEKVRKQMSEEQKKLYPDEQGISYSTMRVTMSKKVSGFDGQDDLFDTTLDEVSEHLTDLKEINYSSPTGNQA